MEDYSLRIENLLCELSPSMKGMRALIAKNPYLEIFNVLKNRISMKELEKLQMYYQGIKGKSILTLQEDNYDFNILISDLTKIVKNNKGEK